MPTPCDSVIRVTLDGKTDAFPVNTTVQTVISRLLDACGCRRPRCDAGRRVQGAERIPD